MDGWDGNMLSEVRVRQTNTVCFYLNAVSKNITNTLIRQNRNRFTDTENKPLPVGRGGRAGQERGRGLRDTNY